jgi:hypothetical protein
VPLLGGSSLLDINQVRMAMGAKNVAEFLLRAAKFSMVFCFGFGFGILVLIMFF